MGSNTLQEVHRCPPLPYPPSSPAHRRPGRRRRTRSSPRSGNDHSHGGRHRHLLVPGHRRAGGPDRQQRRHHDRLDLDPAGNRLGVKAAGTVNWLLPDLHGSVAAASTPRPPRSRARSATTATAVTVDDDQPGSTGSGYFGYQGRLDISPGGSPLYDMSARFYAPGLGTFTQPDSYGGEVANPASMNRYLYAEGNPATLIDPTGHRAEGCVGQDCGAIARASERRPRQQAILDLLTGQRHQQRLRQHAASGPHGLTDTSTATVRPARMTIAALPCCWRRSPVRSRFRAAASGLTGPPGFARFRVTPSQARPGGRPRSSVRRTSR